MTQIIVDALEKTGQRGIINKGWGGLGNCKFFISIFTLYSYASMSCLTLSPFYIISIQALILCIYLFLFVKTFAVIVSAVHVFS